MNKIFRIAILVAALCAASWYALPYLWPSLYDTESLEAFSWNGYGQIIPTNEAVPYLTTLLYFISLLGMYLYKNWARVLFLLLNIFYIAISPFYGISVSGPVDAIPGQLGTLANGFLIAIAYLTGISSRFRNNA